MVNYQEKFVEIRAMRWKQTGVEYQFCYSGIANLI